MFLFFKLGLKEIKANYKFSIFFILNLMIGLTALGLVDSLKNSISNELKLKSKTILAADLSISARRQFNQEEFDIIKNILPRNAKKTEIFESYTMLSSSTNSRLVEVRAINKGYPFYGEIELTNNKKFNNNTNNKFYTTPSIWLAPETLIELNLKLNDTIKLGSKEFVINDLVIQDGSSIGVGASFAPSVYVAYDFFKDTGLVKFGTTGSYSLLIKLESDANVNKIAEGLNKNLEDPEIKIITSKNANEQIARILNYLGDYLGLVSLATIFLTIIGQVFLYQNFLVKKEKEIAIYKFLGLSNFKIYTSYFCEVLILGILAIVPAVLLIYILLPLFENPIAAIINSNISLSLQPNTLAILLFIVIINNFLISSPLILKALKAKILTLLHPKDLQEKSSIFKTLLFFLPALVAYYILTLIIAKSFFTGSLFFSFLILAVIILFIIANIIFFIISKIKFSNLVLILSFRDLSRSKFASFSIFLAISFTILLANLIPIIEKGIKNEFVAPKSLEQPSLFLVDIQEEQLNDLSKFLSSNSLSLMKKSPTIRARLAKVNDAEFTKQVPKKATTREEETEQRFKNRGFNLSYKIQIDSQDKIISSLNNNEINQNYSPLSIEERFAKRLDLKLGDILTFEVQGVEISGQIINLRKVRWTSFQPNFFIVFLDQALTDAPKTFIGTLKIADNQAAKVQTDIVKKFPNISIINIKNLTTRIGEIISQMTITLKIMAIFSVILGLIILYTIISYQIKERFTEINLYKTLGADFSFIKKIFSYQYLFLISFAIIFGSLVSYLIAFFVSTYIFDSELIIYFYESFIIGIIALGLCGITIFINLITILDRRYQRMERLE